MDTYVRYDIACSKSCNGRRSTGGHSAEHEQRFSVDQCGHVHGRQRVIHDWVGGGGKGGIH